MWRSTAPELARTDRADPAGGARHQSSRYAQHGTALLGLVLLLGAWAWASRGLPSIVLPTPARTGQALIELARSGELVEQLGRTLWRTALGSTLGIGLGSRSGSSLGFR